MDEALSAVIPDSLREFISDACGLPVEALRPLSPASLPDTARRLLVHQRDMTSTLSTHHGSDLRVEVLQQSRVGGAYLREVFLRAAATDAIVEYGVISVALERFTPERQATILAGEAPLGELLHRFQIPFESTPVCFFSVPPNRGEGTALASINRATCYGRFNQLAMPSGGSLAWIMEILPGSADE